MKNNTIKISRKRWMVMPVMLLLVISLTAGCSSSRRTVTTETAGSPGYQTTVVEKETVHTDSGNHGLLGGTFHVVGEILAFPFEVIANVFRFIF